MASILKLDLQGIRAFDVYAPQQLVFSTPLTLICGANGVGKTTIIEALRYVTTGDLPPNAKGGAFVHDPRMASNPNVRAQVKLLFTDSGGHRMVVTRSMQLTISSSGKATFKTLEGNLATYSDQGKKSASISNRCADLDAQVPHSLGVPPPILNYVVFCHQEDSFWPLSEPSVVKKRFDEIFEATKYSKALESLKTIRKDYVSEIRVDKVTVENLEKDRQRVEEKQKDLATLERRIEALTADCSRVREHGKVKTKELNNIVALSQRFQELRYAFKEAQRTATRLAQDAELMRSEITLLDTPTPALEEELAKWSTNAAKLKLNLEELQSRRSRIDSEVDSLRQTLAGLSNQQGRVQQALESRNLTIKRRDELAGDLLPHLYREDLDKRRSELDENIAEVEVTHRQRESELGQIVSAENAKVLSLKQTIVDRRSAAREADAKVNALQKQIDEHDSKHAETDMQYMSSALSNLESKAAEARQRYSESAESNEIDVAQARVNEQEVIVKRARTRLQKAIEASESQAKLFLFRDALREAESQRDAALKEVRAVLENPEATYESAEAAIKEAETAERIFRDNFAERKRHYESRSSTENEIWERICSLEEDMEDLEGDLDMNPEEFEWTLDDAEQDLVIATSNREHATFTYRFFSEALAKAKGDEPTCLLCGHHKSKAEAESFIDELSYRITGMPMSLKETEDAMKEAQSRVHSIHNKFPNVQRCLQMKAELDELVHKRKNMGEELEVLKSELSFAEDQATETSERYTFLSTALTRPLKSLLRSTEDLRDNQAKIETEAAIMDTAETETPQQAQQALDETEATLRDTQTKLELLREEARQRQQHLQSLEQRISNLKLRISEYDLAATRRKQAEESLSDAKTAVAKARQEISAAQAELPAAEKAVEEAQATMRSTKHEFAVVERDLVQKRSTLVDAMRQFDALESDLRAFEAQHGPDPLARIESERSAVQSKFEAIELTMSEVSEDIAQHERKLADLGSHQRQMRDNLRLRKVEQELVSAREKESVLAVKHRESETTMGDYEHHIKQLQEAVASANAEIATKTGEAKALAEQVKRIRHELSNTYKGTAERYREAVAQLQSNEGAADDLVKYVRALDEAIMRYHSLKMADINALLDELWKRTYTGTDIDTILIRSESDAGSASARASYNYRVCMVKQDTELDMRGRCSAGQKVLASILIRMALAECFGNNLGLIVLDEPTTNLDRENIEALAQSLSEIIKSRQAQANFQLIVITHDEHFLAQMNPADHCSWYYRIQRNAQQHSTVERLPVSTLS